MNLFDYTNNRYISFFIDITNRINTGEYFDRKKLIDYFHKKSALSEDMAYGASLQIGSKGLKMFEQLVELGYFYEEENRIFTNHNSIINHGTSKLEREFLAMMLEDSYSLSFLSENTIKTLSKALDFEKNDIKVEIIKNVRTENTDINKVDILKRNLPTIVRAINKGHKISCVNHTNNGEIKSVVSPYRIWSSLQDRRDIKIIAKPQTEDRLILMNVCRLDSIKVLEELCDGNLSELAKKHLHTFSLKVKNENNVGERAFMLFSHLKKRADYNIKQDTFILNIDYYDFDTDAIVKDILSLGPFVYVLPSADKEVERMRSIIVGKIKKSIQLYN